ncbi:hypothetical protein VOLCADRAFT_106083 [Volvox carteri f. nagariensis]|uniref:Uncharacterized protein n=1 Tax=Volvox carteri f. nagariensis TaxID=3068 RepID=D8U4Y2_VOLCA|nr:uncharacterized protein VOLCADRAFT_106083 [Volvox carteri f. nagariensis]EFJ45273.1 hypothetical protein VOLCADRAFT_106083 [Volvox carteri f. nagariensis]|eukprot:XP_002953649.1 hypothetical protein VOLCADRAFT_106083 [Volvox carteri f. nagariensis]
MLDFGCSSLAPAGNADEAGMDTEEDLPPLLEEDAGEEEYDEGVYNEGEGLELEAAEVEAAEVVAAVVEGEVIADSGAGTSAGSWSLTIFALWKRPSKFWTDRTVQYQWQRPNNQPAGPIQCLGFVEEDVQQVECQAAGCRSIGRIALAPSNLLVLHSLTLGLDNSIIKPNWCKSSSVAHRSVSLPHVIGPIMGTPGNRPRLPGYKVTGSLTG